MILIIQHNIMIKKIFFVLVVSFLAACSSVVPPMNQQRVQPSQATLPHTQHNDNQTLLVLTFSGGGTRAAALSYGVLQGLNETYVGKKGEKVSLLSEVDLISAVSGGSFTAAYYGLFGQKIFSDYEHVFLKHTVQSELLNDWLSPRNWGKLGSDFFNRSDLAAEYYSQKIFRDKNFSAMRKDLPLIVINATDISTGTPFSFTPSTMNLICSDLESYSVSRAVAASSAVPGIFSPIALKNFGGCEGQQAKSPTQTSQPRRNPFRDKKRYPYLHLVDGGISDNLGIRPVLEMVSEHSSDFSQLFDKFHLGNIKDIVIIVVDSADDISPAIATTAKEPSIEDTIGAVTTLQSRRYNIDTMNLLRQKVQAWEKQMRAKKCSSRKKKSCTATAFHIVELNLKQLPSVLAEKASLYKTSLELPENQVDTLIYAGQYLLKHSQPFLKLVDKLNK